MPNHITHYLRVSGPSAHARMSTLFVKNDDGEDRLDFNTVIPMPECIDETGNDSSHEAIMSGKGSSSLDKTVLALMIDPDHGHWQRIQKFKPSLGEWKGLWHFEDGEINRSLEAVLPGCIERAKLMARCVGLTGYPGWYEWSNANWGTKWNAYESSIEVAGYDTIVRFDAAWAIVWPILNKIAETWPDLSIELFTYDDGNGYKGSWTSYAGNIDFVPKKDTDDPDESLEEEALRIMGITEDWDVNEEVE